VEIDLYTNDDGALIILYPFVTTEVVKKIEHCHQMTDKLIMDPDGALGCLSCAPSVATLSRGMPMTPVNTKGTLYQILSVDAHVDEPLHYRSSLPLCHHLYETSFQGLALIIVAFSSFATIALDHRSSYPVLHEFKAKFS
jgi:hypothetical protein